MATYAARDEPVEGGKKFKGNVTVSDRTIRLWSTQLDRYYFGTDVFAPDYDPIKKGSFGSGGGRASMAYYAGKEIREQLLPQGWVIRKILKQKRLVKSTGKVWYFEVIATPKRR